MATYPIACENCGEEATRKLTFLLHGARSNPHSTAYRHYDCSRCEDAAVFVCEECCNHGRSYEKFAPEGMEWCAAFPKTNFPHMFEDRRSVRLIPPLAELLKGMTADQQEAAVEAIRGPSDG